MAQHLIKIQLIKVQPMQLLTSIDATSEVIRNSEFLQKIIFDIVHLNKSHTVKITVSTQMNEGAFPPFPILSIVSLSEYLITGSDLNLFRKPLSDNLIETLIQLATNSLHHNIGMMCASIQNSGFRDMPIALMPPDVIREQTKLQVNRFLLN